MKIGKETRKKEEKGRKSEREGEGRKGREYRIRRNWINGKDRFKCTR